jgi:spermidine/putrescine transport system substrate-binding protein
MIAAPYYLPKGTDATALGFWYPTSGTGVVGNDTMTVLRGAQNPVLAHHFLNFMLDETNAYDNFYNFNGYQPPLNNVTPESLVADEAVPENLASAVLTKEDYDRSQELLELAPEADVLWQNAWAEFRAGV